MLKRLAILTKIDFRAKYAGHSLGAVWAFLYPAVTVLLYYFVFRIILKTGPMDGSPYLLWLLSALAPFLFLSDSAASSASALTDYAYIAGKSRLNLSYLPAARVISSFAVHAAVLAVLLVLRHKFSLFDFRILVYIGAELLFALALAYFLSVMTVFFRDLKSIVPIVTQLGFWVTPIFWSFASVPEPFAKILRIICPSSYISEGFRSVLAGTPPAPAWYGVYFWIFTSVLALISGYLFFAANSRIADYL